MRISDWSSDVCSSDLLFRPDGCVCSQCSRTRYQLRRAPSERPPHSGRLCETRCSGKLSHGVHTQTAERSLGLVREARHGRDIAALRPAFRGDRLRTMFQKVALLALEIDMEEGFVDAGSNPLVGEDRKSTRLNSSH